MEIGIMVKVTKKMQESFKQKVLNPEITFFNDTLHEWSFKPTGKDAYQIPLLKNQNLPALEVYIYTLSDEVNVVINYLPEKDGIWPLPRKSSALSGLKDVAKYIDLASDYKDVEEVEGKFKKLSEEQ